MRTKRTTRVISLLGVAICLGNVGRIAAQAKPQPEELQLRLAQHANLFRHYDLMRKPLTTMTPDTTGTVTVIADFLNDYAAPTPFIKYAGPVPAVLQAQELPAQELAGMSKRRQVIVLAKAVGRRSAFTPQKGFIYSDWDFEIVKVFKNISSEPMQIGGVITVTRPGGTIIQNGVTYSAQDKTFPDFEEGSSYVLFLEKPLADSSHYFRVFPGDPFLMSASGVSRLDDYQRRSVLTEWLQSINANQFLQSVEDAASNQ